MWSIYKYMYGYKNKNKITLYEGTRNHFHLLHIIRSHSFKIMQIAAEQHYHWTKLDNNNN